jgi:hypothetical protein
VAPADAIVTVRSLPRRFREALARADHAAGSGPDASRAVLAAAARTTAALDAIDTALRRVELEDNPAIDVPPEDPSAHLDVGPAPAVLDRLAERADAVAALMAGIHGSDWSRTGQGPQGPVSALDLARLAVRIAVEQLREAERAAGPEPDEAD